MKKVTSDYKLFGDSLLIKIPKEYQCMMVEKNNDGLAAYDISTGTMISVYSTGVRERVSDEKMIRDIVSVISKKLENFNLNGVYKLKIEGGIINIIVMTYKGSKGTMFAMNGYLINGKSLVIISMATLGYYIHKMQPVFFDILKSVEYINIE